MISPATIDDAAALTFLVNSAYRGDNSRTGWTTEADLLDGIRTDDESIQAMISKRQSVILKYEDKADTITGCVYLEKQKQQLYLGMLTVTPAVQNSGIGKQLLQAAEAYARTQQCTSVVMSVISVRHELIQWYERHGYKKTGATKPFPADDRRFGIPKQFLEFSIMEKPLQ
jgi:ribosomal protein S18 acetylase RimI-like enzyme